MIRKALCVGLVAVSLSACTSTGFGTSGPKSAAGFEISPTSGDILADDLIDAMEGVISTAQTLVLVSTSSVFAPMLEAKLRARGYAVETADKLTPGSSSLPVTYSFDRFEDGQIWAQLRVGDGFQVSRLYQDGNGVLEPISPRTIRQLGAAEL